MWLPERCQYLGDVDTNDLSEVLNSQPIELWDADENLKKLIAGNRQTQSIYLQLLSSQDFTDILQSRCLTQDDVPRYSGWSSLYESVEPLLDNVLSFLPKKGVVTRIQIARMLPGAVIGKHIDFAPLLAASHRLHIPLKTNSDVYFFVDNERVKMEKGKVYDLNNRVEHWVENRSNEVRVHLIIDYLPPEHNQIGALSSNIDQLLKVRNMKLRKQRLSKHRKKIKLPVVIATSVIRGASQNASHGGVYLVDLNSENVDQVVDWNTCDIDFQGRGWDRGLRGICIHQKDIYIAASNELFCFDKNFKIQASYTNPYLKHAHEMMIDGGYLYITSTGFDSILRFDLKKKVFDLAWEIRLGENKRLDIRRYMPTERYGPHPGNSIHINSVFHDNSGLYVSGRNIPYVLRLNQGKLERLFKLPQGTHNATLYKKGVLYNDTLSDRLVYDSTYEYVSFPVRQYPEEDLLNTEFGDERLARQAFGRGLCQYQDDIILAGSSPSTITAFDLVTQTEIKSVNISMDIRNAIHGLEIWNL